MHARDFILGQTNDFRYEILRTDRLIGIEWRRRGFVASGFSEVVPELQAHVLRLENEARVWETRIYDKKIEVEHTKQAVADAGLSEFLSSDEEDEVPYYGLLQVDDRPALRRQPEAESEEDEAEEENENEEVIPFRVVDPQRDREMRLLDEAFANMIPRTNRQRGLEEMRERERREQEHEEEYQERERQEMLDQPLVPYQEDEEPDEVRY